jgi:hypothetical protein
MATSPCLALLPFGIRLAGLSKMLVSNGKALDDVDARHQSGSPSPILGALLVAAPKASAGFGSCASTKVCLYPDLYGGGQPKVFNGEDVGCLTHEGINPLSIANHTGNKYVSVPGQSVTLSPGEEANFAQPVTGLICITT